MAGSAGQTGGVDGVGGAARFSYPSGVAVDASGNVYVADTANSTIRKTTSLGVVSTLAGVAGQIGSVDGAGSVARFFSPRDVAVDVSGNVYVADTANSTIRKMTSLGVVTTLAGSVGQAGSVDGTGSAARFSGPSGVAVDALGNVYVADSANSTIRKITSLGVVTTLAGSAGQIGSTDGTGGAARFSAPYRLAVDAFGDVYVADFGNSTIRRLASSGVVTTLAGSAGKTGSADGTGSTARFSYPSGVAVDAMGNVYVADNANSTIRRLASSGVVTTLAGSAGQTGAVDGAASAARFSSPSAVAVDTSGNVYVADTANSTIRKMSP